MITSLFFFFQAEDGIRDLTVTGVQTCALPISLAEAMVSDVLHALRRSERIDKVIVVTGENGAEALARAYDAESIPDDDRGHSHAARAGVDWAMERDYERVLLVPGDCPALDPRELDELVAGAMSAPDVVIVPDRHGTGTNALLL